MSNIRKNVTKKSSDKTNLKGKGKRKAESQEKATKMTRRGRGMTKTMRRIPKSD